MEGNKKELKRKCKGILRHNDQALYTEVGAREKVKSRVDPQMVFGMARRV